jgi:two-component system response regulator YesN
VRESLEELRAPEVGLAEALALCCEILYPILERLEGADSLLDSLFPGEPKGWRCLFSASSPRAAAAWLEAVGDGVGARLDSAEMRGRNPLVAGVRRFVVENWASRLSLSDVARRFEVSPNHLSTLFKKYAGLGFSDFVAQVKVEKAKELIAGGRYKMFQIAQLVGFEDAFYFSKVFKRVAGVSPRDYYLSRCEREPSGGPAQPQPGTDE